MAIMVKEKAMKMLSKNRKETGNFLRVTITEGGCAGMTYHAEFDHELRETERVVFEAEEVQIISDAKSANYLEGLVIDYSDDLLSGGLRFTNENTQNSCGCGSSFSLAGFPVKQDGSCSK